MTNPVERVVVVGITMRGRRHAAIGVRINGTLRVRHRGVRSLCGVPVNATSDLWEHAVDKSPEICKACVNLTTGGSST